MMNRVGRSPSGSKCLHPWRDLAKEYVEPARRHCVTDVGTIRQPLGDIGQCFQESRSRSRFLGRVDVESEFLQNLK